MNEPALAVLAAAGAAGETVLRSPKVGLWSDAPREGALLTPGSSAGTLRQLTRQVALVIPEGVSGRIAFDRAASGTRPVAYGEVLFRVVAVSSLASEAAGGAAVSTTGAGLDLAVIAPTDGVFYRSGALGAPPFVSLGDKLVSGRTIGLIEVMKTFNPIAYGGAGLPDEAEVVEILAGDGAEVRAGQPLVVVKKL